MKLPKILRPKRSESELVIPGSPRLFPKSPKSPRAGPRMFASSPSPGRSFQLLSPKSSGPCLFPTPQSPEAGSSSSAASAIESELAAVFRRFDSNGDGQISAAELESMLRCLGESISEEEVVKMVQAADLDGDGLISLDEFIRFNGAEAEAAELRAAFRMFDLDQNGFISADELHRVLVGLGDTWFTMEDCGRMIRGVDVDGDGRVDFEEFKVMMMTASA